MRPGRVKPTQMDPETYLLRKKWKGVGREVRSQTGTAREILGRLQTAKAEGKMERIVPEDWLTNDLLMGLELTPPDKRAAYMRAVLGSRPDLTSLVRRWVGR